MRKNVNVKLENIKVNLTESAIIANGRYRFYDDSGKEIDPPQDTNFMKLNFVEDKENGTVCFTLTKEALRDIVDLMNKLPDRYTFQR